MKFSYCITSSMNLRVSRILLLLECSIFTKNSRADGTRTHNLPLRRRAPYPLGHGPDLLTLPRLYHKRHLPHQQTGMLAMVQFKSIIFYFKCKEIYRKIDRYFEFEKFYSKFIYLTIILQKYLNYV